MSCLKIRGESMNKREFSTLFNQLKRQFQGQDQNEKCVKVELCINCTKCFYCEKCSACFQATYCSDLQNCVEVTHCHHSNNCTSSAYLNHAVNCHQSYYLTHCENCYGCTHCYGSVGLRNKEYHILNESYSKDAYFKQVELLKKG